MEKQQVNELFVNDYNNGKTFWEISEEYNETYKNVYESITGHRFEYKLLPEEEKDRICKLYLDGMSTVKLGKLYGVWNHSIANVLEEKNISRDRRLSTRTYTLDEHYFDEIDTNIKAYIYGLLLSDGYNNPDKQTVSISLQEEDAALLERVRKEIKSTKPLEYLDYSNKHDFGYHYKNQYRLLLFSDKICSALTKHGLVKNKSLIVEFPSLDDIFISSMVRGTWDGDGTLGLYKNHIISVSLTATQMFCDGLKSYVENKLGIFSCHIYDAACHNGITRTLQIGRNDDKIKFLEWMYDGAEIYLQRKYDKYLEILNYYYNESKFAKNINNSLSK